MKPDCIHTRDGVPSLKGEVLDDHANAEPLPRGYPVNRATGRFVRERNAVALPPHSGRGDLASVEEILSEVRAGRPVVIVDAADRENEGDLIIAAQFASHHIINFMARHARGLICLALTQERVRRLRLPQMTRRNGSRHRTAFAVSIEAASGVTTGISAHDRARTIATAIDPTKSHVDLVSPGHVFPIVARRGGVLTRAGHTEAAVDIARLAGLTPAGVICEIMNDDGTMARVPDLVRFCLQHGIRMGAIADLVSYRMERSVRGSRQKRSP
jgi:3,4-dihydroxy 2-butanone 4-phosphate synthase/GTP cyclohydrolase II